METCYYPAFLNIKEKLCVVVGGGKVAERKVLSLLRCGAKIKIISPDLTKRLQKERDKGNITHICRKYIVGDLAGAFLVVAATSNEKTNTEIASMTSGLINVVDRKDMANFIVPSVIRKGLLTIAISTSGASPAMSRTIRKELEALYDKDFSKYITFLKKFRSKIIEKIPDRKIREQIFRDAVSERMLKILRQRGYKEAKDITIRRFKGISK